jgi:hypothetical protein
MMNLFTGSRSRRTRSSKGNRRHDGKESRYFMQELKGGKQGNGVTGRLLNKSGVTRVWTEPINVKHQPRRVCGSLLSSRDIESLLCGRPVTPMSGELQKVCRFF